MTIQASKIKALFLDLDGVVWHGTSPIGDLGAIFTQIEALGILPLVGTNNATLTPEDYVAKFAKLNVTTIRPEYIFSPAIGAVDIFREIYPKDVRVHVLGSDALRAYLRREGITLVDTDADVVLASLDKQLTYDKVAIAQRQVLNGAKFYATNRDHILFSEEGIKPGGGVIVAALETCTGVAPTVIGKPEPTLIHAAMKRFGLSEDEVLVVGDRYDTDILGGLNAGCPTVLVLTGVDNPDTIAAYDQQPDWICADLSSAVQKLAAARA